MGYKLVKLARAYEKQFYSMLDDWRELPAFIYKAGGFDSVDYRSYDFDYFLQNTYIDFGDRQYFTFYLYDTDEDVFLGGFLAITYGYHTPIRTPFSTKMTNLHET